MSFTHTTLAASPNPITNVCDELQTGQRSALCQENDRENPGGRSGRNPILTRDGILADVVIWIVRITAVASVIMVIIGGLRYTFSAGDSNTAAAAKNTIQYALVGLVVATFAGVITAFVLGRL